MMIIWIPGFEILEKKNNKKTKAFENFIKNKTNSLGM